MTSTNHTRFVSRSKSSSILELLRGDPDDELVASLALMHAKLMSDERLVAALDHFGSAVEVVRISDADELAPELFANAGAITDADISDARRHVRQWRKDSLDVRTVFSPTYPSNLRSIFDRPPLLFVAGAWDDDRDSRSVAVVGTRKASESGLRQAKRLVEDLVAAGFTVLSGMARGIDTVAQATALERGGRTVAVMGTGIDRRYPPENASLAQAILDSGAALLTQFLPHSPPSGWHFPKRNVVMSGLARATVVIEAAETSGARMQARVALQHGRTVFLLRSLVEEHEWARRYVEQGAYGSHAIELSAPEDLIARLAPGEFPVAE